MNAPSAHAFPPFPAAPALAAGAATGAFGLVAFSPFGTLLASVFAEGWLAVYMDAQAFRLFCL
jgi:hypothetical protein